MAQGAQAVHAHNPRSLVFISGLVYDGVLTYLVADDFRNHVPAAMRNKIVYEAHAYGWDYPSWLASPVLIDGLIDLQWVREERLKIRIGRRSFVVYLCLCLFRCPHGFV
jgi:hypothetical protein